MNELEMAPARAFLALAFAAVVLVHGAAAAGARASPRRLLTEPRVVKAEGHMPLIGSADDAYLPPPPVPSARAALKGAEGSHAYSSGSKGKYGGYGHGYGYGYGYGDHKDYGYGHEKMTAAGKAVGAESKVGGLL